MVTASREPLDIDIPAPPTLAEALGCGAAIQRPLPSYLPGCFVCGPERSGWRRDAHLSRASFTTRRDVSRRHGLRTIRSPTTRASSGPNSCGRLSTALATLPPGTPRGWRLLGKMSAVVHRKARVGEPLIVTGWPIDSEGRKHRVGCALHDANGELVAAATATWITVSEAKTA